MTAKIQINVSVIRLFKWKENGKKKFFFYINDDDDDDDLNRVIRSRTIRKKKLWSSVCVFSNGSCHDEIRTFNFFFCRGCSIRMTKFIHITLRQFIYILNEYKREKEIDYDRSSRH